MRAFLAVDTRVSHHQPLNGPSADDMRFDDFVHIGQGHAAIPNCLGIDHKVRAMFALIEAPRLIGAYSPFQSALRQLLFEELLQFGFSRRIATTAGVPFGTLVPANEDMPLKFWHKDNLHR